MRVTRTVVCCLLLLACCAAPVAAQTSSFQILSGLADFGANFEATSVSADGAVIIGKYFLSGADPRCGVFGGCTRAFRWTVVTGAQDIGVLDGHEAEAHALSADGSLIVGEASSSTAFRRAFIRTPTTGMQDIGTPIVPNGPDFSVSRAIAISATGSVIVGEAVPIQTSPQPNLIPRAFRFTTSGGFEFLTTLPNEIQGRADGVSADGTVIVGRSYDSSTFLSRAFRWKAGVAQDLGHLGGGESFAFATSSDGSVVVGLSRFIGGFHPFRWTAAGGMQDLGDLGGNWATAVGVSADGTVVVGTATPPPPGGLSIAFRWTASNGLENLNAVAARAGVSTAGWQLVFADAVSADGRVIVGLAENLTTNVTAGYRLVLPPPVCARVTCASLGKNCGTISDGCGGTLTCGGCTAPGSCGGGGVANLCGPCTATTSCGAQASTCGAIPDGCGWVACGTCTAPQVCGGGGNAIVCAVPPPVPTTLAFSQNPVVGGTAASGTVTLSQPAPIGGALVTLSATGVASVPPNVMVPAGATSAAFTITTTAPVASSAANVSACFGGHCVTNTLFITAPPAATQMSSLMLSPTSVTSGTSAGATVTLSAAAPASGASVTLSSSNAAATVPPSVTVPAGSSTATFTVTTQTVTTSTSLTISASFGGVTATASLAVTPTAPPPTITRATLTAGQLRLEGRGALPNHAIVVDGKALGTSDATGAFKIVAQPFGSPTCVISVNGGGSSAQTTLSGCSPTTPAPPGTLAGLTLGPTSVVGPASSTGTVTLTSAAPAGGIVVTLSSGNSAVASVPALGSVTVQAGATSATFTVTTVAVTAPSSATITATAGSVTRTAVLTVTPPAPPAPPPPPSADTVGIKVAEYVVSSRILNVQATSASASATLTVFVTSTGVSIGTLTNNGGGKYTGAFSWPVNPTNVTVKSSLGGAASSAVKAK